MDVCDWPANATAWGWSRGPGGARGQWCMFERDGTAWVLDPENGRWRRHPDKWDIETTEKLSSATRPPETAAERDRATYFENYVAQLAQEDARAARRDAGIKQLLPHEAVSSETGQTGHRSGRNGARGGGPARKPRGGPQPQRHRETQKQRRERQAAAKKEAELRRAEERACEIEEWERESEARAGRFEAERDARRAAGAQAQRDQLGPFAIDAADGAELGETDLPDEIRSMIQRKFKKPELLAVPLDGRLPAVESSRLSPREAIGSAVQGPIGVFVRSTADNIVSRLQGVPVRDLLRAQIELISVADGAIGQGMMAEGAVAMGMARAVEEVLGEKRMGQRPEGGEYAAAVAAYESQKRQKKSEQKAEEERESRKGI